MNEKVTKNQVSYFEAGYKAGLLKSGVLSSAQIEKEDYTTTQFKKEMLKLKHAYDKEEFHYQGLEEMYKSFHGMK